MLVEKLRLIDFLRLPDDVVDVPSRFPIEQIVEACTEGQSEQVVEQCRSLIQHNAYGHDSLDVLALRGNGLFYVGELRPASLAHWPNALQTWLRLIQAAKRREQSARQAGAALLALAEAAERLARDKEAAEQAKQLDAEAMQRRVDDWSKLLAARHEGALELEKQRDRRSAVAVVALMEERVLVATPKPVQESANDEVNGNIHYVSKATVVERLRPYCPKIQSILENVSGKRYYWLKPAKAPDRGWNFTLLVELLEEKGLLTPSAVETIRAAREAGAANWGVQFASQLGQRR